MTEAEEREPMLEALRAELAKAQATALSVGQCSSMRKPSVVVVSTRRTDAGLVLVWYGHWRIVHYAQSGSDWGDHVITVKETTFGSGAQIASERLLAEEKLNVPESDEKDYDDDKEAREVALAKLGAMMKA